MWKSWLLFLEEIIVMCVKVFGKDLFESLKERREYRKEKG